MFRVRTLPSPVGWLFAAVVVGVCLINIPQAATDVKAAVIGREWDGHTLVEPFERSNFDDESPSGHSVAADCQAPEADYPYTPYDWPDANAVLTLAQQDGASTVTVELENARPDTYYTMWLRLRGEDVNGETYGGSPLSGSAGTPLAPTSDLPALVAATGEGNGNDQNPNGFWSDADGNATFSIDLDFPIINGAYPFHRYSEFDPTDVRLKAENPALYPVAIVGKDGPFTFRLVSHCTDDVGHGLSSAQREWWFLWKFE